MKIVLKKANFELYGLVDVSSLLNRVQENYSGITDISPVENLLKSLGADGSNEIWSKLKKLFLPVLASATDGYKALYDVKSNSYIQLAKPFVVEEKRGVSLETLGENGGTQDLGVTISEENVSEFAIITQSSRQTLGTSSGLVSILGTVTNAGITWYADNLNMLSCTYENQHGFTRPYIAAVSKEVDDNHSRRIATLYGDKVQTIASKDRCGDVSSYTFLGTNAWASISVLGICDGLSSDETIIVRDALSAFVQEFGVECVNS